MSRLDFRNDPRAAADVNDPAHWRFRAEEMRAIADEMRFPPARDSMLRNAAAYERMAQLVELYPVLPRERSR